MLERGNVWHGVKLVTSVNKSPACVCAVLGTRGSVVCAGRGCSGGSQQKKKNESAQIEGIAAAVV